MNISIGPDDEGRTVRAHVGDTLEVTLPENPTTGVRWAAEDVGSVLQLTADHYQMAEVEEAGANRPGIGAGSTRVLIYLVCRPGRVDLRLTRRQEWERDPTTDATFSTAIDVSPKQVSGS